jgi:hypothetical protein
MRSLQKSEVNAVSGALGYWSDELVYDCYYDAYIGWEVCDAYVISTYYQYSPVEEALIWTSIGLSAAAIIAGTACAIALA